MSTIKDKNFDYQNYMKENSPDAARIKRGTKARRQRFESAIQKFSVRIEEDIFEQYQQLALPGHDCEQLINQALREWLSAKSVKEMVRTELQHVVRNSFSSFQAETAAMKISDNKPSYNK